MGLDYKLNWDNLTPEIHLRNAKIAYDVCKGNGGLYIKFGQAMSQMEALVPDEWVDTFEPMQQNCPTSPFKDVKQVVEGDLGRKLEDVFSEFEETPVASASLAQVHRARLRSTGELVAVKV